MSRFAPDIQDNGIVDYLSAWQSMRDFTSRREAHTPDQIRMLQHEPVYTMGLSGHRRHLAHTGTIPVVHSDRGGQATYHAPGQLVVYPLLNLRRLGLTVKRYVWALEQSLIHCLADLGIQAARRPGAPGVYVREAKIAALGLRVRKHCSYHGLALNVHMDLTPFQNIHPCGFPGLAVTQLSDLGVRLSIQEAFQALSPHLLRHLGYRTDAT